MQKRTRLINVAADETLLDKASHGDETAFLLLYERYRNGVFRFSYRMLGSIELAEDVTHDCFLALIRKPQNFDPERASLKTYLYAAARNLALKSYSRREREVTLESAKAHRVGEQPLDRLLDKELSIEVHKAVSALPHLQREALTLFEFEELSLAEIAMIVGAEVGTVKARIHRARESLRRSLAPHFKSGSRVATTGRFSA